MAVPWAGLAGVDGPQAWRSLTFPFPVSARVTQLIRGFGGSWKASVESLSQDVMRSFTNFRNGTSIIQVPCHSLPFAHVSCLMVSLLFSLGSHRPAVSEILVKL